LLEILYNNFFFVRDETRGEKAGVVSRQLDEEKRVQC